MNIKHDEYNDGNPNGENMPERVHHELDLALDIDTIAFFGVVLTRKSLLIEYDDSGDIPMPVIDGLRNEEIIPTMVIVEAEKLLSEKEREQFARGIIELGRMILRRGKKNEENKTSK